MCSPLIRTTLTNKSFNLVKKINLVISKYNQNKVYRGYFLISIKITEIFIFINCPPNIFLLTVLTLERVEMQYNFFYEKYPTVTVSRIQ